MESKPFNIEDRIDAFEADQTPHLTRAVRGDLRKHFGDLKPALSPEEVEAVWLSLSPIGKPPCVTTINRNDFDRLIAPFLVTRHAVAQDGEACLGSFASQGVGVLKARAEARAEAAERKLAEMTKQRDLDCERANNAAARADAAEKELAEAKAKIQELQAWKSSQQSHLSPSEAREHRRKMEERAIAAEREVAAASRTIISQAHEIRELKEARR